MSTFWQNRRHARVRTLLSSYIDGEVSASEARRVAAHLSGCDECVAELESLRATTTLLGRLPSLDTPRSYALTAADVQDMSPRRGLPSFAAFSGGLATAGAAALVVVLVVGVVFLARLGFTGSAAEPSSASGRCAQPLLRLPKRLLLQLPGGQSCCTCARCSCGCNACCCGTSDEGSHSGAGYGCSCACGTGRSTNERTCRCCYDGCSTAYARSTGCCSCRSACKGFTRERRSRRKRSEIACDG